MATVYDNPEYREMSEAYRSFSADKPAFTRFLDLTIESPDFDHPRITINMREDLVGNLIYGTLHGGVIASILDIIGGHAVFMSVFQQIKGQPVEKKIKRVSKIGSIDLRVDYLRPGYGKKFIATGSILRAGNKVAVTRMELRNENDEIIALGTGSYTVG